MKITACVPLPGQGLVARSGDLVVLTDGLGGDPDPLLTVLDEVAAAGADGAALVRSAARAALDCEDQPAWACVGVTGDGELVVLVHGAASADISVDGNPIAALNGGGSLLPVSRLVAGGSVTACITLSGVTAADTRLRLDGGIVRAGGVAVTATADPTASPAQTADPTASPAQTADPTASPAQTADPTALATGAVMSGALTLVESSSTRPDDSEADAHVDGPAPVLVDGVLCPRQHFNDPTARYCRECAIGLEQPPGLLQRRPRPSLGVLLLDDGTSVPLDAGYVLGREPALDAEVASGRVRALRITDQEGTVSRLHLRVSLVGWQVEVCDLGSANGSVLHRAEGPEARLNPHDPVTIEPGTRVAVGRRSFQYLAPGGSETIRELG